TMSSGAWEELKGAVLSGLATADTADLIVAEIDGEIVGSVLLFPPGVDAYALEGSEANTVPEVRLLAVRPECGGQSLARKLMDECIRRSQNFGADYLGLHTSKSMRAAMALYASMGFERAPHLDFRTDKSELIEGYRLRLTPPGAPDPA